MSGGRTPVIRLLAHPGRHPTWVDAQDVDPLTLALPPDLTARLIAWADAYGDTLGQVEQGVQVWPADFLRPGESALDSFEREGYALWKAARQARPDLNVRYHSLLQERDLTGGELLDLLNDDGEVIGVIWREDHVAVNHIRTVNAFLKNARGEVFLPRRSLDRRMWPGGLDMSVGGCVEAGESFTEAFRREAREELNLDVDALGWRVLGNFSPLSAPVQTFMRVYEVACEQTPALNPQDFSGGEWLTPTGALRRIDAGEPAKNDLRPLLELLYLKEQA